MANAADDSADGHLREQRIDGRTLVSGGFLEMRRDLVRLPDGHEATREYIAHPGAVAVVPLLDDGRVVLVRQYRYPVAKVLVEFPAGKRDPHESSWQCARRELQEETGYRAREWAYGGEIHNAAAYSSESIWIWFARGLEAGPAQPEQGEFVETVVLDAAALEALELGGDLPDVKTLIGLHWLLSWQGGRRALRWLDAADAARL
ncbi:MAG: NUDIX hydrolase [Rubrivivax sp.]